MEGYRGRILQQNKIGGLLEMSRRYMDNVCYYYYDVTGLISLENILQQELLTRDRLDRLFGQLEKTLQNMDAYLMRQEDLCLRPECIWEREKTGEWFFLYVPEYIGRQMEDMEYWGECMLQHLGGLEEKAAGQIYELYSFIVQTGDEMTVRELAAFWQRETTREREEKERKEITHACRETQVPYLADQESFHAETEFRRRIYRVPYGNH